MYFILAQAQPGRAVPVIAENIGPYDSLDAALADNPGYHEASEAEYEAYLKYWRDMPDRTDTHHLDEEGTRQ
jgi:hypothetical protein